MNESERDSLKITLQKYHSKRKREGEFMPSRLPCMKYRDPIQRVQDRERQKLCLLFLCKLPFLISLVHFTLVHLLQLQGMLDSVAKTLIGTN